MKGATKVIMVATLVMVVSLTIVLGVVLVLLAELYCSLLLRRRKDLRTTTSATTTPMTSNNPSHQTQNQSSILSLSSFYAQGVLNAPRSLLFPAVSSKNNVDIENRHPHAPTQTSKCQTQNPISTSHQFKIVFAKAPSPPASSMSVQKVSNHVSGAGASTSKNGSCDDCEENLVYISNPIYDNEVSQPITVNTPFGTPDSSPSRLEMGGSPGEDDDGGTGTTFPITPPLSPMKKLPVESCSVCLRDAQSLGTTASYSNSNNGDLSSSLSGSPSTSPW